MGLSLLAASVALVSPTISPPLQAKAASLATISALGQAPTVATSTNGSLSSISWPNKVVGGGQVTHASGDLLILRVVASDPNDVGRVCPVLTESGWTAVGNGCGSDVGDVSTAELYYRIGCGCSSDNPTVSGDESDDVIGADLQDFTGNATAPLYVSSVYTYSSTRDPVKQCCGGSNPTSFTYTEALPPSASGGLSIDLWSTTPDANPQPTPSTGWTTDGWLNNLTTGDDGMGGDYHLGPSVRNSDGTGTDDSNTSSVPSPAYLYSPSGVIAFFAPAKDPLQGMLTRNGPESTTGCSGIPAQDSCYRQYVGGFVPAQPTSGGDHPNASNGIGWDELADASGNLVHGAQSETNCGANYPNCTNDAAGVTLNCNFLADGLVATNTPGNALDCAIKDVDAWNTAFGSSSTNEALNVRISAGIDTPSGIDCNGSSPCVGAFPCFDLSTTVYGDGSSGHPECPYFWTSAFNSDWQSFMSKLAAYYDTSPEVAEIVAARNMTVYTEPYLRNSATSKLSGGSSCSTSCALSTFLSPNSLTVSGNVSGLVFTTCGGTCIGNVGTEYWVQSSSPVQEDLVVCTGENTTSQQLTGCGLDSSKTCYKSGSLQTSCSTTSDSVSNSSVIASYYLGDMVQSGYTTSTDVASTETDAEWQIANFPNTAIAGALNPYDQIDGTTYKITSVENSDPNGYDTEDMLYSIKHYTSVNNIPNFQTENNSDRVGYAAECSVTTLGSCPSTNYVDLYQCIVKNGRCNSGSTNLPYRRPLGYQTATDKEINFCVPNNVSGTGSPTCANLGTGGTATCGTTTNNGLFDVIAAAASNTTSYSDPDGNTGLSWYGGHANELELPNGWDGSGSGNYCIISIDQTRILQGKFFLSG